MGGENNVAHFIGVGQELADVHHHLRVGDGRASGRQSPVEALQRTVGLEDGNVARSQRFTVEIYP